MAQDDYEGIRITGQPSGPRSWSEYETQNDGRSDPAEQFDRRNCKAPGTMYRDSDDPAFEVPDPRAGTR